VRRVDQNSASSGRRLDHAHDIGDLEHHLVRTPPPGRPPPGPNLRHHQLGRLPVGQPELRAVPFPDADVLDETEDIGVPRHRRPNVGHGQNRGHSRMRRRSVRQHPATVDRHKAVRTGQ
jgi:hypothetical protein